MPRTRLARGQRARSVVQNARENRNTPRDFLLLAEGHECPHLARRQKVFYARGFQAIFEELPRKKVKEINQALSLLFGRNPYYKMRRGDRLTTPKAQAMIRSTFLMLGIATEDTNFFDTMEVREEWM